MKIKQLEKEYKIDFKVNSNMKVSTYFRKQGLSSLAKALEKIDDKKFDTIKKTS